MLSSYQTAAIFSQQQQMFAGMQQYSQQISASMPQPYQGTLAASGLGLGFHPGAFNYGNNPSQSSYGPGNTVSNAAMSAASTAIPLGMTAASIAGGLGVFGSAGKALDPFSMGAAAFRGAGSAGFGLGGRLMAGAAGFGAVAAPIAGAAWAGGQMVAGGQEQAGIEQALSRFQHQNPMSRTGRGFTRQDSMQIGNMVRELAHIPDMLTSVGELTKIMDKVGGMGIMNGVKDAQTFQEKFKQTLGTIKDVARIMGTTLEGAAEAFGEARRSGFYSQNDVVKNAVNRQVTSGLTGMSQQQVSGLQSAGAQMGFATGGSRASGARNVTRMAQQLGAMNQAGILSNDQILELTGEEGGAGIASMAASMTEAGYRMSRSSLGTAMTAALGQVEDGKFTGKMDEELAQRMRRGELSKGELMKLARQKTAGRAGKLSFSAHRERLTSEMVGSVGGEGIGMMMGGILGDRGFDNPDALNLVMQRMGVDERTAEQLISVGKMGSTGELQARQGFETKRLARTAYVNENFSWDAIKKKIGTKIEGMAEAPLKQMGADIRNYFAKVVDEFVDDVTGRYSAEMTKGTAGLLSASAGGSKTAAGLLSGAGSATGMARFGGGAPQIGMAASLTRSVFGLNSSEQGQRALTTNLGMGGLYGKAGAQAGIEAFNKRIDMYAQGVGALRGKSEYQGASQELQEVLRTMPEGLSEEEKLKHIKDKVGGLSDHNNWGQENTTLKQSAVEKLAKASGKNIDEVLASMMSGDKQLSAMSTAVDYKKIGAAIGGMETDLKKVAGERKKLEDSLSGKQGFSAFVSGQNTGAGGLLASGMMHKILGDTGASADEILDILQKKEISPEEWKTLEKKYGITPENKDEAKRLALASKNLKGDDRAGTLEWMNKKINEGVILSSTHQKERSSVYSKLAGLGGKLGEAASAIAGAMTSGSVADMGAIGKLLAGDRKAQSAVGSAGGYEAVEAARAYEESMRDPANRKLSKKDREAKAQQAAQASGSAHQLVPGLSEAGSQFASEAAVKSYFEKLNANQSQITQILGNLAAGKPANEGLTADKKTGS